MSGSDCALEARMRRCLLRRSRELTHPCSYRVSQGVREIWNGGHHPRREACWCCFVACGEGAVSSTPKACGYRLLER
jgi:hypothetical protein